jgi:hypothetical protein
MASTPGKISEHSAALPSWLDLTLFTSGDLYSTTTIGQRELYFVRWCNDQLYTHMHSVSLQIGQYGFLF